jgi:hypothetical protein
MGSTATAALESTSSVTTIGQATARRAARGPMRVRVGVSAWDGLGVERAKAV